MNFSDMNLPETILRALTDKGYSTPTEIQAKAIPMLLEKDTDFVGQAQTGTGKTAAFSLPLLAKIDTDCGDVQAIVLSPTRELANQICDEMKSFCKFDRIKTLTVYGGVPLDNQIRVLKKGRPQVVVGTPGRVLDLIKRGVLKLKNAKLAVLDEADEMLDMGFIDDVKTILSELGENKNTWMYSATMPPVILKLIKTYLNEPEVVKVEKKTLSNENIEQKYFLIKRGFMGEAVCRILDSLDEYYGIVFCRTKIDAKKLADEFNFRGFPSDSLHGDMSQVQRDLTMKAFKRKKVKLLVCTDVAARGIDVDNLTHVINYGLPQDLESYVHRIGRTGRAGNKGSALTIIDNSERFRIRMLERLTKAKIEQGTLPSVEDIKSVLVKKEVARLAKVSEALEGGATLDKSFTVFSESMDHLEKDTILKMMFNYMFKENMDRYNKQSGIEQGAKGERRERGERRDRNDRRDGRKSSRSNGNNARFYLGAGKKHGIDLRKLLESVSHATGVEQRDIRGVDLKDQFSFFEVSERNKEKVLMVSSIATGNHSASLELTKNARPERSFNGSDRRGGYNRSENSRGGRRGSFRGNRRSGGGDANGNQRSEGGSQRSRRY
jgi:ATP-dependent RNA helicase DeaD